jgi:Arc/MetJ-type ribon-helix-helix transcriptional regulator
MTTQLAIRFADDDVRLLDEMVHAGVGRNRTEIVRLALGRLFQEERRRRAAEAAAAMWAEFPETAEELARARATAVEYCDAEDWSDIYPVSAAVGGRR